MEVKNHLTHSFIRFSFLLQPYIRKGIKENLICIRHIIYVLGLLYLSFCRNLS
jgi:hypothetical protein